MWITYDGLCTLSDFPLFGLTKFFLSPYVINIRIPSVLLPGGGSGGNDPLEPPRTPIWPHFTPHNILNLLFLAVMRSNVQKWI